MRWTELEITIVLLTVSPPLGLLLTKPAGLLLFCTGGDSLKLRVMNFSALGVQS